MKINVLTKTGEKTSKVFELNKDVFENDASIQVLRQVIHVHQLNTRTGTAKAKGRSEVSGTGRKPWGNNKMGRARTGDMRTPIFTGGGVSHGPIPMNYGKKVTKKMKAIALYLALTQSVNDKKFFVVEDFDITSDRLTNEAASIIKTLSENANVETKNTYIYAKDVTENLKRAFRNLKNVSFMDMNHMNAYDIVSSSSVVILEPAMELLNDSKAKTVVKTVGTKEEKEEVKAKTTEKKQTKPKTTKSIEK